LEAVGFRALWVGPIRYARNLEAMAELWIHMAIPPLPAAQWGRDWTFGKISHEKIEFADLKEGRGAGDR